MGYEIACILLTLILNSDSMHINSDTEENCKLPSGLLREISSYQPIADRIIATAVNGQFRGRTYNELANFVDKFVNRISGSQMLEDSIDYMMTKMVNDGLVNVRGEPIEAPRWIRFVMLCRT
jgi:carboxypeptidase Q